MDLPERPLNVMHVITGLSVGGAETMLYKLLSTMPNGFRSEVISLTSIGRVGENIKKLGVPVRALNMRRGIPGPLAVLRLAKWIRRSSPDVVQTWMYHADLCGGLAAKLAGCTRVVWGIRNGSLDDSNRRLTVLTAKLCARLSDRIPTKITCVSKAAREFHAKLGYADQKIIVIPNGFDLKRFGPSDEARLRIRRELGLQADALIVGLVARFDPQKDHRNFVAAAARVAARDGRANFVMCGDNINLANSVLLNWVKETGYESRFHLLGRRDDIPSITASLDIAVNSSSAEGFSNVIGEAMACQVPCVVTDVGDSAYIVGETGIAVPAKDSVLLAEALLKLVSMSSAERARIGAAARSRIASEFELAIVSQRYQDVYQAVSTNRSDLDRSVHSPT